MGSTALTVMLVLGATEENPSKKAKKASRDASSTPTLVHTPSPLCGGGALRHSAILCSPSTLSVSLLRPISCWTLGFSQPPSFHQVLSESDLDNDNMLSFSEFEHAMAKSPDFMK